MRAGLKRSAIVVFGKLPRLGRVKTRLTPPLSAEEALLYYSACLRDSFRAAGEASSKARFSLHFTYWAEEDDLDAEAAEEEARRLAPAAWITVAQRGRDLGERMLNACMDTGSEEVILVGCDIPELDGARILAAREALSSADVVLGPAVDGGFYLAGLRAPFPNIFQEIPWSSAAVLEETLRRARGLGLTTTLAAMARDTDDWDDLLWLSREEGAGPGSEARAVARALAAAREAGP